MSVKQIAMKGLHLCKQYAPEIMIGASILTGAAALYFTVRGTMKLGEILDDHEERVEPIKDELNDIKDGNITSDDSETLIKDCKKELVKEYARTTGKIALAYAPAMGLAASSAVLNISAHGIMRKRVATALAALESVSGAFEAYRQRVKDRYGEEVEREILTGKHTEKVAVEELDKKGNTKMVDKKMDFVDTNLSPYARYFDAKNEEFFSTLNNDGSGRMYNEEFLTSQETVADLKLRTNGYVFLNDVYKSLGFEQTPEGQLVGWRNNTESGDGCVKFNITKVVDGINENDDVWLLDFNVDGVIFDKI